MYPRETLDGTCVERSAYNELVAVLCASRALKFVIAGREFVVH